MIIASNFKTNHTRKSTREFVSKVADFAKNLSVDVRIYPPSSALDCFDLSKNIKIGAQNFYPAQYGSFTGEIGFEQLEEFKIDSLLVGHSERRSILGESNELIKEKFDFAKAKNVEIIFCIGEPQTVWAGGSLAVLDYLWNQLEGIDLKYEKLIIAYEPVWAIGTGRSAPLEEIENTLSFLKEDIDRPLLYGGSVKAENIAEILRLKSCDGVLVGSASWNVENFIEMIKIANEELK